MLLAAYPVFLLAAVCSAAEMSAAAVEPPSNVTFHCRNMRNVLQWSYGEMVPGLRFRVDIYPYYPPKSDEEKNQTKARWVEPPNLHADLSQLSSPKNDYTVTVTAVVGGVESSEEPSNGITFSYFQSTIATYKCFLDFPPVNVSAKEDDLVQIHFEHPWLFYGGRRSSKNTKTVVPEFKYKVELVSQNTTHDDTCESRLCFAELQVHAAQETHCVKVNGEWEGMSVKGKQAYCMPSPKMSPDEINYTIITIVIVTLVGCFGLVLILCMVYKKKTSANTRLPSTLTFSERLKQTLGLTPEQVSVLRAEPCSPTPLLDKEGNHPESIAVTPDSAPADLDVRLQIGPSTEDEGADEEEVGAEDNVEGLAEDYLTGKELEDEEEEEEEEEEEDEAASCGGSSTGYEKRMKVAVQLAQDETLEGYRCRRSGESE